jgi:hypothetical protein
VLWDGHEVLSCSRVSGEISSFVIPGCAFGRQLPT